MKNFSFDDVLIEPKFSFVRSRKDVDTRTFLAGSTFTTPIVSSNMDTITGAEMARVMLENGAQACLHRFQSIDDNVKEFNRSCLINSWNLDYGVGPQKPWVSIGISLDEFERAQALVNAGADTIIIDVAHGANIGVVEQYARLREKYGDNVRIIVGNFASRQSIMDFDYHSPHCLEVVKIGIGNGAACTTRIKTGVGVPQLSAIIDCAHVGLPILADGGCKNSGDIVKAIAAGASAVMAGRLLAGTTETPGDIVYEEEPYIMSSNYVSKKWKVYRGSASKDSYQVQGKESKWRTPEGESYQVPLKGSAREVLQDVNAGLRSAMSYVGASNISEFRKNAEFVHVSTASIAENGAHGQYK